MPIYMKQIQSLLLIFIALCHCAIASAQTSIEENEIVRSSLDEMFEDLDKTKIPTGLLLDYAVDLVDFSKFDGISLTDSNYVNCQIFEDILRSVRSAAINRENFGDINLIMESFKTPMIDNSVNIGILFYKYNYIKASALTDGLIEYDSSHEKVTDAYQNGIWLNPYSESFIFAFSPSSNVCVSGTTTFHFSTEFLFNNQDITYVYFDPGDGNGYRYVAPSSTISINYSTTGSKELKLKILSSSGSIKEAHSTLFVVGVDENIPTKADGSTIEPTDSLILDTTYNGTYVRGQLTYFSKSSDGSIQKPFIVVEGFDPWILESIISEIDNEVPVHLGFTNYRKFIDKMYKNCSGSTLLSDYDIMYLDWDNSIEDIRANAQLLTMFIERVNEMKKETGSTEKNVIMGQSMGGLAVRYALRTMERANKLHEVSTYISHDSPHLGANVPLGALYFIPQLISMAHGYNQVINLGNLLTNNKFTDAERALYSVLHCTAAKQMLVNYVDLTGNLNNDIHNAWQEELKQIGFPEGDFGQGIQNLAIVNGGTYDITSTLVNNNQNLLYFDGQFKSALALEIWAPIISFFSRYIVQDILNFFDFSYISNALAFWGSSQFNFHAEVNPLTSTNAGNKISELKFWYTKKYLWLFPKTYNLFSHTQNAPSSGLFYDDFPGSIYHSGLPTPYDPDPFEGNIDYVGSYKFKVGITNQIMFIPTASALAITGEETSAKFSRNYYSNPPIPQQETAFDSYHLANNSEVHIQHPTSATWGWVEQHLIYDIAGPEYITDDTSFSIPGYYGGITWSTSNSNIATIDNSGHLTVHGNGLVSIIAEAHPYGQLFKKEKKVLVGFPDIVIKSSYSVGEGYVFKAESTNSSTTLLLDQLVSSGSFRYEWSLFDANGDKTTQTSSSNTFKYLPKENEIITLAVRLISSDGNKGPVKSVSINLRVPFNVNYNYVIVTNNANTYFIKSNGTYETGLPTEDFTVTYNYTAYSPNDNVLSTTMIDKYLKGKDCYIAYPISAWREGYLTGTKASLTYKWSFPFFDLPMFLNPLEYAINNTGGSERTMHEFDLTICNSAKEKMQKIPFVIIYKTSFPEN